MNTVSLVKPSTEYEREFLAMAEDWRLREPGEISWYVDPDCDLPTFVAKLRGFEQGLNVPEGFVPNSTFWLADDSGRILGALNLRHELNDFLLNFGGQIGYCIRPSERGKGYGKEILRLGLIEAKKMGFEKVLVCCYKDNIASARIIEGNGGVMEDEREYEGKMMRRYWIKDKLIQKSHTSYGAACKNSQPPICIQSLQILCIFHFDIIQVFNLST